VILLPYQVSNLPCTGLSNLKVTNSKQSSYLKQKFCSKHVRKQKPREKRSLRGRHISESFASSSPTTKKVK
jgi:hypothetical protein